MNEELNNSLLKAAARGQTDTVKKLIAEKADVNYKDKNGYTSLHWAATYGHIEVARALIAAKAKVNVQDKDGYTPLHWAAANGHIEAVRTLIAAGADVNAQNNDGNTSLHKAADLVRTEIVQELIAAGADVNALNSGNETPLDIARYNTKFYDQFIDAIAKQINDSSINEVKAFMMGTHKRVEANCPVKILAGEPGIMQEILGKLPSLKLSDIPEKHRKAVEGQLNKSQEKHVGSHAAQVTARSSNNPSQGRGL